MRNKPGRIIRFWKELKRRHVHRSLAIYAGTAFIILEAATIIFPRWDLPDWTIDLMLYLLILGAFITLIVAWIFDITPQGVQKTKPLEEFTEPEKSTDSKVWKAATYISLVIIVALVIFNIVPIGKSVRSGDIQSLVVLPFDNFTGSNESEYYVAGMHSSLITDLGQLGALRVMCKTTANSFKGTGMSVPQIASKLKVDAVVEGSISCLGDDSVCVQIRLISAIDEEQQLWVQDFRVAKSQIYNFYNNVTKKISREINIVLTPQEESLLAESKTVNPHAYDAYLKGKYSMGLLSQEGITAAMGYFQKAIDLDPEFAAAYGGLGGIWVFLKQMDFVSTDEANPHIMTNLNKALELDSTLADVYYWDALKKVWTDYNWEAGEKSFKKALAMNPNFSEARGLYSNYLMSEGRWTESEFQMSKALETDPNNPFIIVLQGMLLMIEEKYDSCVQILTPLQKSMPTNPLINLGLFVSHYKNNNFDLAMEQTKLKLELEGHKNMITLLEKEYKSFGYKKSLEKIAIALENKDSSYVSAQSMQYYYAISGNEDKTMDWIEKGYIRKDPDMPIIAVHPLLIPYRNNSRYKEMVRKMNLPLNKFYTLGNKL